MLPPFVYVLVAISLLLHLYGAAIPEASPLVLMDYICQLSDLITNDKF